MTFVLSKPETSGLDGLRRRLPWRLDGKPSSTFVAGLPLLLAFLLLWEMAPRFGWMNPIFFPPLTVVLQALWDLTGRWQATEKLRVRGGILNLLDTDPPFSNQAYFFIAGYDPSYSDPRGRSFYLALDYKFR